MARYWGPKITIDGAWVRDNNGRYYSWLDRRGEQWEAEVQNVLRKIEGSKSGKLLLSLINGTPTHKSRPRRGQSPLMCEIVPIHAVAHGETRSKQSSLEKSMKKGSRTYVEPPNDTIFKPRAGEPIPTHVKMLSGTGDGSAVRIYYHPATWTAHSQMIGLDTRQLFTDVAQDSSCTPIDQRFGLDTGLDNFQPDDVLFHELVHAYRAMLGIFEFVEVKDTWHFTEEFFAVVLTNIYVSETGRSGSLRGDHSEQFHSLKDVSGSESDESFYLAPSNRRERTLIDQLCEEMPELTDPLSDLVQKNGTWNPLRVRREQLASEAKPKAKF
jgi:hypothetical protein